MQRELQHEGGERKARTGAKQTKMDQCLLSDTDADQQRALGAVMAT